VAHYESDDALPPSPGKPDIGSRKQLNVDFLMGRMLLVETGSHEHPGDADQIEVGLRDSRTGSPSMTSAMAPWNAVICARIVSVDGRNLIVFPVLHRGGLSDENG